MDHETPSCFRLKQFKKTCDCMDYAEIRYNVLTKTIKLL